MPQSSVRVSDVIRQTHRNVSSIVETVEKMSVKKLDAGETSQPQPYITDDSSHRVAPGSFTGADSMRAPHPSYSSLLYYATVVSVSLVLIVLLLLVFIRLIKSRRITFKRTNGPEVRSFLPWSNSKGGHSNDGVELLDTAPGMMISHSLPDLSRTVSEEKLTSVPDTKKVARQTTLPTVPQRHELFQRQLSHNLQLKTEPVQFSVCSIETKKNLGQLKPELYRNELVRQSSVDSCSDLESAGTLSFSLKYEQELEGLTVKIIQASDLPVKDVLGSSDPYVKVYLLPERKKKFVTKVHRRNLNPVFNETFVFSATWASLLNHTLQFSIYDFDRFSRNDVIGQVLLRNLQDYCQVDRDCSYTMDILTNRQGDVRNLGELMMSLCYLPTAGRLTVTIIKMRNLRALDITGSSDPYVKVILMCQGKRIKKKKTTVQKATLNPIYNESLVFDVPNENVDDVTLLFKIIDYDRLGSNELLGAVVVGSSVVGTGRTHWLEMLESPRRPVTQWYSLQESVPPALPTTPLAPLTPGPDSAKEPKRNF